MRTMRDPRGRETNEVPKLFPLTDRLGTLGLTHRGSSPACSRRYASPPSRNVLSFMLDSWATSATVRDEVIPARTASSLKSGLYFPGANVSLPRPPKRSSWGPGPGSSPHPTPCARQRQRSPTGYLNARSGGATAGHARARNDFGFPSTGKPAVAYAVPVPAPPTLGGPPPCSTRCPPQRQEPGFARAAGITPSVGGGTVESCFDKRGPGRAAQP